MSWTGYCAMGEHDGCPDTATDNYACDCPCHLREVHADDPTVIKERTAEKEV